MLEGMIAFGNICKDVGGCGRNESIWEDVGGMRVYGRMWEE